MFCISRLAFLRFTFHHSIDICTVVIKNIKNIHAVSTNQIADILHYNDNTKYTQTNKSHTTSTHIHIYVAFFAIKTVKGNNNNNDMNNGNNNKINSKVDVYINNLIV